MIYFTFGSREMERKIRSPIPLVTVDVHKKPWEQSPPLHNRWHPKIPPVASVEENVLFRIETVDWTGGQISPDDNSDDVRNVDLSQPHYLSGPIAVKDSSGELVHPGDLLVVEICDLGPLPGDEWGFTGTFDIDNGGGFLTDHFPCATKAIWDFEGIFASSRHIPGVRFPGLIHPGLIGTAPSQELLDIWNKRERELEEAGPQSVTLGSILHTRPMANLPQPKGALVGGISKDDPEYEKIISEAARTIPGRENGGNCDIKFLSKGSKIYFPVFVEGGNLSMGDMHFSQGSGEISFCGAIEMSGFLHLKCSIIRGGMDQYLTPVGPTKNHVHPLFEHGPVNPSFSDWLVFEGISVDETGRQHYLDATVAFKRAVLDAIHYFSKFGYTQEQIYLLLSCCPCEGRIAGIVDSPNAVATLAVPTAIFDQDVLPVPGGPPTGPRLINRGDVCRSTRINVTHQ